MRTPRLSEIDLTVADDVSVVAMVPVPGPHPTAHTVPCNTSERREPGRAAACVFILTTGSYDHVSRRSVPAHRTGRRRPVRARGAPRHLQRPTDRATGAG